jgi:hypothetical protein
LACPHYAINKAERYQIDDGPQDRLPTRFAAFEQPLEDMSAQGLYDGAGGPAVEVEKTAEGAGGLALGVLGKGHAPSLEKKSQHGFETGLLVDAWHEVEQIVD